MNNIYPELVLSIFSIGFFVGAVVGWYCSKKIEMKKQRELRELVDGAYEVVVCYRPEGAYNAKWREKWIAKAVRLVPQEPT